jgi:hypothetical protein
MACLIPTTTLKSSSNVFLIYFLKLNLLPGARWTCKKKNQSTYRSWFFKKMVKSFAPAETHRNESMSHGQVISLSNRSEELSKEAYLDGLE